MARAEGGNGNHALWLGHESGGRVLAMKIRLRPELEEMIKQDVQRTDW